MVYNLFIRYVMQNIQFVCNVIRSNGLYLKKKLKEICHRVCQLPERRQNTRPVREYSSLT